MLDESLKRLIDQQGCAPGSSAGCEMLRLLQRLFNCPPSPRSIPFALTIGSPRERTSRSAPDPTGELDMAVLKLQPQQEAEARLVNIVDARGRPARFDGVPTWETSSPGVVDLRPGTDGLSCLVGSLSDEGTATVTVTGDARQGEEVVPITGVLSVVVAAGDVAVFEITAGEARDRAAPTPPPAA